MLKMREQLKSARRVMTMILVGEHALLSFFCFSCSMSIGPASKHAKLIKNPSVDTSFLPDREHEEEECWMREELCQGWLCKKEELKKEEIETRGPHGRENWSKTETKLKQNWLSFV